MNDLQRLNAGPNKSARSSLSQDHILLDDLVSSSLVLGEDLEKICPAQRQGLAAITKTEDLLAALVDLELLTVYQAGRIGAGTFFGLILGNYRVLDRLGAGGMGVVFRAEHIKMRKQVAIKVLSMGLDQDARLLNRFMTEIRAIAQLQHPNIVSAIDAGELTSADGKSLHFFVMEYVPGQDLEDYVRTRGPLAPAEACDLMHQIASALGEANKNHLVHRDIKPSNIQVTPEGQAKLLDFGLARRFSSGLTEQGAILGTLDYMAPEQVEDAHTVDIRADLYGLGGVLYWCLTGTTPFPSKGTLLEEMVNRIRQPPPNIREKRPEISPELEKVIQNLMALNPSDRYLTPQAAMRALLPFLTTEMGEHMMRRDASPGQESEFARSGKTLWAGPARTYQVLLVDDEASIRSYCKLVLQAEGMTCDEARGGKEALALVRAKKYDLLLLDINMDEVGGPEVCRELRANPPSPNLKIIMSSGHANTDTMAQLLQNGADDFLTKPFSVAQLQSRVKAALRLKDAQDSTELLRHQLLAINHELEKNLTNRNSDLAEARNALVLALANLVQHRANETGFRLNRLQKYVRALGEEAGRCSAFADQIDENFVDLASCCAPLHDIGKIGLPDHILMKPTKLDAEERLIMQSHPAVGAEMLQKMVEKHPSATAFLRMAIEIARHHHERYDGTGYPDGLAGADIPLAARLVSLCDVYDALRSRRSYKPSLSHSAALQLMSSAAGTQFDPALLKAFQQCSGQFEEIFTANHD